MTEKEYLGDGVYVDVDEWGNLTLTTENGIATTNTIIFEPQTLKALTDYINLRELLSKIETKA